MRSRLRNTLSTLAAMFGLIVGIPTLGLMLLAEDGGGEGGEGEGEGEGNEGGEGGTEEGGDDDTYSKLTPEQRKLVDEQVTKRLSTSMAKKVAAEKKRWEKEVTEAGERAKMEESERLKAEKADAEQAVEAAKREALTTKVEASAERLALKAKVDPDKVERFLRIADLSNTDDLTDDGKPDAKAIGKLVESTLKAWPEFQAKTGTTTSGGDFGGGSGGDKKATTLGDAVEKALANAG